MADTNSIKHARELIVIGDSKHHDVVRTRFESLGNEVYIRSLILGQLKQRGRGGTDLKRFQQLSAAFRYVSLRLSDVFARLDLLDFIRNEIARMPESDRMAEMTKDPSKGSPWMWNVYAGLAIKDFHVDISSVMDSIAPVVLQVQGEIKENDKSPGFPDIQNGSQRSYRNSIPSDVLKSIDETDRWWLAIKKVRDVVIHREHHRIVFPALGDDDSLLFQVYEGQTRPIIVEPQLMYPHGNNVIDFALYSGFVMAHLLVFLEDLADSIAQQLKIQSTTPFMRWGNFRPLAASLDRLVSLTV